MAKSKQSILSRAKNIFTTQTHSVLDRLEDPVKGAENEIREYGNDVNQLEAAVAHAIGSLRMMENDQRTDIENYKSEKEKALKLATAASKAQAAGDGEGFTKYEALARVILDRQITLESKIRNNQTKIENYAESVEVLKRKLTKMREDYNRAVDLKNELVNQKRINDASQGAQKIADSISGNDRSGAFAKLESAVRKGEASVIGYQELGQVSDVDSEIAALEAIDRGVEIEARMAALTADANRDPLFLTTGKDSK